MRVIVCGGREFNDPVAVARALQALAVRGPHTLVHGACKVLTHEGNYQLRRGENPGADRLAHFQALAWGWEVEPHPDHWAQEEKLPVLSGTSAWPHSGPPG